MKTKICTKCGKKLPATLEYFRKKKRYKYGLDSCCKECKREYEKEYYWKNREKTLKRNRKNRRENPLRTKKWDKNNKLKHKFGITLKDYNQMLEDQDYKCKICGIHQDEFGKSLIVDHNHKNGKIRGLLCQNCNIGIGNFRDNIKLLQKTIKYLRDELQ